eukprot:TRINITY_DN4597_c0_g1_i1.p2 TRINITY_DN4597_c0_g1~~TRINITY_DN4597_c0_g1_i1.p2  ORF type:complete len:171 (-),score=37.13 TRINITY_DN4597_c0_g1_i1:180-692(-)
MQPMDSEPCQPLLYDDNVALPPPRVSYSTRAALLEELSGRPDMLPVRDTLPGRGHKYYRALPNRLDCHGFMPAGLPGRALVQQYEAFVVDVSGGGKPICLSHHVYQDWTRAIEVEDIRRNRKKKDDESRGVPAAPKMRRMDVLETVAASIAPPCQCRRRCRRAPAASPLP